MRHAIYLTPPRGGALERAAARWLGRSAFDGGPHAPAAPSEAAVAAPARYGFHATLKAPFAVAAGAAADELHAAFADFAAAEGGSDVRLHVGALGDFLALLPDDEAPLAALAARAVRAFEPFRAPLTDAERTRRNADAMDPRGRELLETFGYPHVMERFRFHMTLTGPVADDDRPAVAAAARTHFGPLLAEPQPLRLALFVEDTPGGPFRVEAVA